MWLSIAAISIGAALGANLRWLLNQCCNRWFTDIPPGTLLANLIGAWLIGIAAAYFSQAPLSPQWRLFIITGLLGGLTTFSTFSLEMVSALQNGRWLLAGGGVLLHVVGSLLLTGLGMASYHWFKA